LFLDTISSKVRHLHRMVFGNTGGTHPIRATISNIEGDA